MVSCMNRGVFLKKRYMTSTKILNCKDVTIMAVTANFGIRWIPVAAGLGASALSFWILGAIAFFIPLTIIAASLSKSHPELASLD